MKTWKKALIWVLVVAVMWLGMAGYYATHTSSVMASLYRIKHSFTGYSQGGVLLVGSSSMQIWRSYAQDLGPLRTENVGISGSVVGDWPKQIDSLVTPFAPKAVVLYIGANDIHAGKPRAAADVATDVASLAEQIHAALPETTIYYISIYPQGSHPNMRGEVDAFNVLARAWAEGVDYVRFVDCASALMNESGQVREDIFLEDGVHLNKTGYAIWATVVREALSDEFTF